MDPVLVNAFQSLLIAIVVAIVAVLASAAKKAITLGGVYLEQKLGLATFTFVKDYVATTVRFVEQSPIFKELTGPDKKKAVVSEVAAWCQARNIPIDAALIDKLTEEAVQVMNTFKSPELDVASLVSDLGNPMMKIEAK